MVKSTLPGWLVILSVGFVFAAFFGFINHYIPKEQKEKAELIRSYSRHVEDCFVEYTTRFSSIWYLMIGTMTSVAFLVELIIANNDVIMKKMESWGAIGTFVMIVVLILVCLAVDLLVITVACAGESLAIHETKDHYWRRYGAVVVPKEDE